MDDYIRAQIKYLGENGIIFLGEISVATWGESEELSNMLAQHFNLPKGQYDLYVLIAPEAPLRHLANEIPNTILLTPRYTGPLIKP